MRGSSLDHSRKEEMLRVREIILASDERISESIKWSTPTFEYEGNLVSFQPRAKRFVSLMFHRGADVPGKHPILEGDAKLVRTARLDGLEEINARRADLEAVVRAWCDRKS